MEIRPSLIAELVKREFSGRYRGSSAGILWAFLQPLFLLAVYTLAFGVILQARWGGTGDSVEFAFLLFSGLIVFNAFSECLNRAPTLIVGHPNFVKKVVFPLEILSWVVTITVLLHALIGTGIWLLGYLLLFGLPHPTFLLFPFVLLAFFPVLLGIGWLLSALGVILRDIGQITGLVSHILLFLTPIFYSIESAPSLPTMNGFVDIRTLLSVGTPVRGKPISVMPCSTRLVESVSRVFIPWLPSSSGN